jgi:hypothetical protein
MRFITNIVYNFLIAPSFLQPGGAEVGAGSDSLDFSDADNSMYLINVV